MRWFLVFFLFAPVMHYCSGLPRLEELPIDEISVLRPDGNSPSGCADGSDFFFLVRRGTSNNILLDFMGGGACWNFEMCKSLSTFHSVPSWLPMLNGRKTWQVSLLLRILGISMPALTGSAFGSQPSTSDWTYVFVPYCTQDVHLGNRTVTYRDANTGQTLLMHHNGAANVAAVIGWMYASMQAPQTIGFIGCSAGAAAVLSLEAVRAQHHYNNGNTKVVAIGDSPTFLLTDAFAQQDLLNWGIECVVEEVLGVGHSLALNADILWEIFDLAFAQNPEVTFSYYTATEDQTAIHFWRLMGGMIDGTDPGADTVKWKRQMLAITEHFQRYPNFNSFVRHGDGHCTMSFSEAYTYSGFSAWAGGILLNRPLGSQDCGEACQLSGVVGCDGVAGSKVIEDHCNICGGDGDSCASDELQFACVDAIEDIATTDTSTVTKTTTLTFTETLTTSTWTIAATTTSVIMETSTNAATTPLNTVQTTTTLSISSTSTTVSPYENGPFVSNNHGTKCSTWYGTLSAAQAKCNANPDCVTLHDYACDGHNWRHCTSTIQELQSMGGDKGACTQINAARSGRIEFVDGPRVSNGAIKSCSSWYGSLSEAMAKCKADSECSVLHDYACDEHNWRFCTDKIQNILAFDAAADDACTKVLEQHGGAPVVKHYVEGPRVSSSGFELFCSTWYGTLVAAELECNADMTCSILYDFACDGHGWRYCTGVPQQFHDMGFGTTSCTRVESSIAATPTYVAGQRVSNMATASCGAWYGSLEKARERCSVDPECIVLHDWGCDGHNWRLCTNSIEAMQSSYDGNDACTQVLQSSQPQLEQPTPPSRLATPPSMSKRNLRTTHN